MVQAVDRALDVLEAAYAAPDGLTLQALVEATGLRPTTAHNLAATLVQRGYLSKSARPTRYRAGPALASLAMATHEMERGRWLEAAVRDVARRWPDATVTAAVDRGGEVTVVARMSPDLPQRMQHPSHQMLGPYHSVSALVFQAFWPQERRTAYRQRYPFDEYGTAAWPTEAALAACLDEVRRQGCAVLCADGLLRVAAPVFTSGDELIASLGVAKPVAEGDAGLATPLVETLRTVCDGGRALR